MSKLKQFAKYMKEDGKKLDFVYDGDVLYALDKDKDGGVYYEHSPYGRDEDVHVGHINYLGVDTERGRKVRTIRDKDRDNNKKWGSDSSIPDNLDGLNYELELWFQSYRSYFESIEKVKEYVNSLDIVTLANESIKETKAAEKKARENFKNFKKNNW